MPVLQAPVANYTYTVNGRSYTSGQDGRMTVSNEGDVALLRGMGISDAVTSAALSHLLRLGARSPRILFKELLPNLAAPILVYTTLIIPTNILTEAALSFLGVGIPPPNPSWGGMMSDALSYYTTDPMYMIIPGVFIFVTVLAFNLFGDGLRDALDPKAH